MLARRVLALAAASCLALAPAASRADEPAKPAAPPAAPSDPAAPAPAPGPAPARDRELEELRERVRVLEERVKGEPQAPSGATTAAEEKAKEEQEGKDKEPAWYERIVLGGFVDIYYAYNTNRPQRADLGESFIPGTGTTAKRHNRFDVNLAAIQLGLAPDPVGFNLDVVYGTGTQVLHFAEPDGDFDLGDVSAYDLVYRASVAVTVPIGRGILVEAGILPAHVGFEAFYSKDNYNYTRSYLGELQPYYQTGVSVGYGFTDEWSAKVYVLNGWNIISENNSAKSLGAQVAYKTDGALLAVNGFAGPELEDDTRNWRYFGEVVGQISPLDVLDLATQIDVGWQEIEANDTAVWHAYAAWVRVKPFAWLKLCVRGEIFADPENGISGFEQTIYAVTGTIELTPLDHLSVKLEARYDDSDEDVFATSDTQDDGTGRRRDRETIYVVGVVVYF